MDAKQEEFLKRLRATFREEAWEHCRALSAGLLALEKKPEPAQSAEIIESVFREAHSLKGAARSVGFRNIESLCQALESLFGTMKHGKVVMNEAVYDVTHQAVDEVYKLIEAPEAESLPAQRTRIKEMVQRLESIAAEAPQKSPPADSTPVAQTPAPEPVPTAPQDDTHPAAAQTAFNHLDTVRMPIGRLEPLLLQAEEMILARMAAAQRVADMKEISRALSAWREDAARLQSRPGPTEAATLGELLEQQESWLNTLQSRTAAATHALEQDCHSLERMVSEHLEAMKSVLMLPISSLTEGFPRLVRDLARDQGKEAQLVVRGAEMEMDKRVLEELKDPLIHLLRNSVDHGIEKPDERARRNKPRSGTVTATFEAKEGRQAEITVSDDGAGIDSERVLAAAAKSGARTKDRGKTDEQEALSLIFQSGVTTSPIITDISGRGLGLAIVREKVEKLGGALSVSTEPGGGATFRLIVPMTLATFKGVLIEEGGEVFVLPTVNVERAARVRRKDIASVESCETVRIDGRVLSLVRLNDVLGMPGESGERAEAEDDYVHILVLLSGGKRIALQVNKIVDEQEVLVKGLGSQLRRVPHIAGATILGTGRIAPVLHVADIMQSASHPRVRAAAAAAEKPERKAARILVAEDSITARTLLKNILETAGYRVSTAVDGIDALTQFRSGEFDLLVSDVDMPRMSGFELTNRVRGDKKRGETPVILVTALESREDRERGIEAGANAYIVKSSFDQSNLLETIQRFI